MVREVVCHSGFFHIHVAQFHEVFLTDDYLAIVMEYAPGGDLLRYVRMKRGLQVWVASLLPVAACASCAA